MGSPMNDDDLEKNKGMGHNSELIDDVLAAATPEIFALEQEIKAATEAHLEPIRKKLSKQWNILKGKTGFSIKYMKSIYNIYKLAEEAKLFDDDKERTDALDALRTSFQALEKGGHLDLLRDILEEESDGEDPAADAGDDAAGDPDADTDTPEEGQE